MKDFFLNVMEGVAWALIICGLPLGIPILAGCHDGCEPDTMRCNGDRVEVCNTETDWELSADCSKVEPVDLEWECCVDPEDGLHACLPALFCEEPDAGDGGT